MKKEVFILFGIIIVVIISGCTLIIPDGEEKPKVAEVVAGPGGCQGDECEEYCEKNPIECQDWCKENPETCRKILEETEGHEQIPEGGFPAGINPQECKINPQKCIEFCEKNPGVCPEEHLKNLRSGIGGLKEIMSIIGPAGCRGPACQQYCQQNMDKCQDWCNEK